ncbi:MAG TPA: DUF1573 domain-containing protein [Gemmatales bacterium]|nr:DUF1573 domain-containing protein [Gemmatales bacterium]HMP02886.1 DUF1573 domain-containing protein [Gemmatales bacterium]
MRIRSALAIVIGLSLGVLVFSVLQGLGVGRIPRLVAPIHLDLGEHEAGDLVIAELKLGNGGEAPLVVDQIHTDCGCAGVEREANGKFERIGDIRLAPGEDADLRVRLTVPDVPGADRVSLSVYFRTNDPCHDRGKIALVITKVNRGLSVFPQTVAFGSVHRNDTVTKVVEIRDRSQVPRKDWHFRVSPGIVSARALPLPVVPDKQLEGELVGRLEITVDGSTACNIDSVIEVAVTGESRKPTTINVVGKVVTPLEVTPSVIALPLRSRNGPVFDYLVTLRSQTGNPVEILKIQSPEIITTQLLDDEGPRVARRIRVALDPSKVKQPVTSDSQQIQILARSGDIEETLNVQVIVRELPP